MTQLPPPPSFLISLFLLFLLTLFSIPPPFIIFQTVSPTLTETTPSGPNPTHQLSLNILNWFKQTSHISTYQDIFVGNNAKGWISLNTSASRKQSSPNFPTNEHFLPPDTHTYVFRFGFSYLGKTSFIKSLWQKK